MISIMASAMVSIIRRYSFFRGFSRSKTFNRLRSYLNQRMLLSTLKRICIHHIIVSNFILVQYLHIVGLGSVGTMLKLFLGRNLDGSFFFLELCLNLLLPLDMLECISDWTFTGFLKLRTSQPIYKRFECSCEDKLATC